MRFQFDRATRHTPRTYLSACRDAQADPPGPSAQKKTPVRLPGSWPPCGLGRRPTGSPIRTKAAARDRFAGAGAAPRQASAARSR